MPSRAVRLPGLPGHADVTPRYIDEPLREFVPATGRSYKRHYGFHPFPGRKDAGIIQAYIRYYTREGDTVLDVFGGSGTTAREALILRRRVVIADINPVAELITRASILPVDLLALDRAFLRLDLEVGQQIRDIENLSGTAISAKLSEFDLAFLDAPIHRLIRRGAGRGIERLVDLHDPRQLLGLLLLRDAIRRESDDRVHLLLDAAFSHTLKYATRMYSAAREGYTYWGGNAAPFQHGAYQVPEQWSYLNVWEIFSHVFENVRAGKQEAQQLIGDFAREGDTFVFIRSTAADLPRALEKRGYPSFEFADYCITDPPYAERVQYTLLFSLWYPWLELDKPEVSADLTVPTRGDYARRAGVDEQFVTQLGESLRSVSQALKPGAWLTLFYQHPNLAYWKAIVDKAAVVDLQYVNLVPQPSVRSFSQLRHPFQTIAGSLMLNLRKLSEEQWANIYGRRQNRVVFPSLQKFAELEMQRVIVEYLGAPTDTIAFHVIPALLDPKIVSDKVQDAIDLVELIKSQNLAPFGAEHGENGEKDLWMLKEGVEIDPAIDFYDRLRYHLFSLLRRDKTASMLQLQAEASRLIASERKRMRLKNIQLAPILSEFAEMRDGEWCYSVEARTRAVQMRLILAQSSAEQLRPVFFSPEDRLLPLRMEGLSAFSIRYGESPDTMLSRDYRRLQNLLVAVLTAIRDRFSDSLLSVAPINEFADGTVNIQELELADLGLGIVSRGTVEEAIKLEEELAREIFGRVFLNSGVMFTGVVRPVEYAEWLTRKDLLILLGEQAS